MGSMTGVGPASTGRSGGLRSLPQPWRWIVAGPWSRSRSRAAARAGRAAPAGQAAPSTGGETAPSTGGETTHLLIVSGDGRPGWQLIGEVDLATRSVLQAALHRAVEGTGDIELDLAELAFIDVGGATVLADAAQRLGAGRRLVLHNPSPMLRRIIELGWGPVPGLELRP